ncbi:MAG TPA: hypothetical protein VKB48_02510 [Candidatus Acidoferrum sp.]|nr:hypothetical protein [Candidatus Acidoferrum sp.]
MNAIVMVGFTAITCDNLTDGETRSIPYTVTSDGTNAITDPHGNLLAACELPGFALPVFPSYHLVAVCRKGS